MRRATLGAPARRRLFIAAVLFELVGTASLGAALLDASAGPSSSQTGSGAQPSTATTPATASAVSSEPAGNEEPAPIPDFVIQEARVKAHEARRQKVRTERQQRRKARREARKAAVAAALASGQAAAVEPRASHLLKKKPKKTGPPGEWEVGCRLGWI